MTEPKCACGQPLHYSNPAIREAVERVARGRDTIPIFADSGVYSVQIHYIALHGVKEAELPELAARGIVMQLHDKNV